MARPTDEQRRLALEIRDEPREQSDPWTGKWVIVSGVLVLALIAALLWAVLDPVEKPPQRPGPATPSGPAAAVLPCLGPLGDQTIPAVSPDTDWRPVGAVAAPIDPAAGPAVGTGPGELPSCYAPTPTGSLVAAANFLAVLSDPTLRRPAAEQLVAPGPGRDAVLAEFASQGVGGAGGGFQIVGFAFIGYTPAAAAAWDLAVSKPQGGTAHLPVSLAWTGGDWRVQLPGDGNLFRLLQNLPTTAGYIPWTQD